MSLSRRRAMAGAVSATLISGVAGAAFAPNGRKSDVFDAIVIGAGLSGLGAARILEEQGLKVLIVEGRQRVGGRVYTFSNLPGHPEAGANSLTPGYGRTVDAAQWGGVKLIDISPRVSARKQELVLGGKVIRHAQWPTSPLNPFPDDQKTTMPWEYVGRLVARNTPLKSYADWTAPASAGLDISLYAFLKSQGATDPIINLAYNTVVAYGTSANDVSALMLEFIDGWIKAQAQAGPSQLVAADGNQRIPEAMAAKLKSDILLGKQVMAIDVTGGISSVQCADGSSYRAKRIVCSMPFSTLRKVRITPALTGTQAQAIKTLAYQLITLVFVIPDRPYWDDDGLAPSMWTDGPAHWVIAQHFGATDAEVTGLSVNARGLSAAKLDRLGPEAAGKTVIDAIERIRPAAKGKLRVGGFHSWGNDPFSLGDWAVFGPGQPTGLLPTMAQPHGNLFFCGEHTAVGNRGMEAALESSERVSIEVLQSL